MNIALSAIIILSILLPGIIFRFSYLRSDSLRKSIDTGLLNELIVVVLPTLLIHFLSIYLVEKIECLQYRVRIDQVFYLIVYPRNDSLLDFELIKQSLLPFSGYILFVCLVAMVLGTLFQKLVLKLGYDKRYKFLKIYNDWDKYFSIQAIQKDYEEKIDYIQLDVVVKTSNGDFLYCGILEDYTLNKNQEIEQIFLSSVYRRALDEDSGQESTYSQATFVYNSGAIEQKQSDSRYYSMPGNYFVIPYDQVINMNVIYSSIVEEAAETEEE